MKGKSRYVLLGLLAEQPLSGYEMKKIIGIRFRFFWDESFGQIYPEIKKLFEQGMITLSEEMSQVRKKKVYQITPLGMRSLKEWLKTAPEKETLRLEILLRVYFSKYGEVSYLQNHLASFKEQHQNDLNQLQLFKQELLSIPDPDQNHRDILQVIEFGIKANQAYLDWCEQTQHYLTNKIVKQ